MRVFFTLEQFTLSNPLAEFSLFESQQYGESDLLFKDATQCLVHTSHMDYRSILGDFYSHAEAVFNCTRSGRSFGFLTHRSFNSHNWTSFFCHHRNLGVLWQRCLQHIVTDGLKKHCPIPFSSQLEESTVFSWCDAILSLYFSCFCLFSFFTVPKNAH